MAEADMTGTGIAKGDGDAGAKPADELAAARRHCVEVVDRSATSFALGMKVLDAARRDAMYALYAFCREVDDVADEGGTPEWKKAELDRWRQEIEALYAGQPGRPTTLALAGPVASHDLPKAEFLAIIDGMEMDAGAPIFAPDRETLRLYCRRVAGAVGLISIRIFGDARPEAERFAEALGEAFQLTNILRDVDEDAERHRLYIPRDLLDRHGVPLDRGIGAVLPHPGLAAACRDLAEDARARFAEADRWLAAADRRAMRPALLMMGIYETILVKLLPTGWVVGRRQPKVSKLSKLWGALTRGLFRPAVKSNAG